MRLTFVGSGDAFGGGGRFDACFHLAAERTTFPIDGGASALIGPKRLGIDRNAVDAHMSDHMLAGLHETAADGRALDLQPDRKPAP